MKQKVTGIVLSSSRMGEVDKRVVLLTKEEGKISAFARGALRPKSPISSGTESLCFGDFYVYRGRDSYTVDDLSISNYFKEIKEDLDKLYMGLYFLEVADYFTREGLGARPELELIYRSLLALQKESIPDRLIRRIYELRMLAISGYSPYYDEEKKAFTDDLGIWHISEGTAYTVGQILTLPLKKLYSFTVSEAVLKELETQVDKFFKRNTEKKFMALDAIKI